MRTIFILMDSLNRHYLNAYGANWIHTPNIDRLAGQGAVFDNHWCGSMPCMPARREMFTGRLNFLETPWGCVEPWDQCLPPLLRKQKSTYSHLITDHYHYFHSGGEGYHTLFDSWEFQRGQEGDLWHPLVKDPEIPPFRGKNRRAYWVNRLWQDRENDLDYPTPQCFERAIEFVQKNHQADNWHLHLEVFDPHEPFVCPSKYRQMYSDDWAGGFHFDWPSYAPVEEDEAAVRHIRKCYAGTLTMADVWLGKLLAKLDELDMWKDTTVVLTTDHGHLLGEHGYWAKNYMFDYARLAHIPMIVCSPQGSPRRVSALTASMDLMPTFMDLHGGELPPHVHGKSVRGLLSADAAHHDAVLFGYFGKDVNLFDGRYTYCRQPLEGSQVHHHTLMPRQFHDFVSPDRLRKAEFGVFLPHSRGIPCMRFAVPSTRHRDATAYNPIYDLQTDPEQAQVIHDDALESRLAGRMKELLRRHEAPACQYARLGLA